MVRMSDILKKAKGIKKEEREEPQGAEKPASQESPPGPLKQEAPPKPKPAVFQDAIIRKEKASVSVSSIVMKEGRIASDDETVKLDEEALCLAKKTLDEKIDPNSIDIKKIVSVIENIVNQLNSNNKKILITH